MSPLELVWIVPAIALLLTAGYYGYILRNR